MSIRTAKVALRGIFVALVGLSFSATGVLNAQVENASPTRMATFEETGETSFALSIGPESQDRQRASDVMVFVDTSASQTGAFKRDSIELLRGLVRNLSGDDRIRIFAVDLEAVGLFRGFVNPLDDKVQVAIENLNNRVALGSTDMESMIESAVEGFEADDSRNHNVIYIGDGISRAGILHSDSFTKAVTQLAEKQISISSFAIGPERNIPLLAALANHTGGNFVIDSDAADSASKGAMALAETVHGSVFWPQTAKLPENLVEVFPAKCPPMRSDRDTILVGSISDRNALNMELTGMMDGRQVTKTWNIQPEGTSDQFAFLPKMLDAARKDGGVSLPTVGSAGLAEYARVVDENAVDMELLGGNNTTKKGTTAIASAAPTAESRVALAARYRLQEGDPANPFGDPADDPFGDPTPDPTPDPQAGAEPPAPQVAPMEDTTNPLDLPSIDTTEMESAPNQQQQGVFGGDTVEVTPMPESSIMAPMEMGSPIMPQSNISALLLEADRGDLAEQVLTVEDRDRIINEKLRKQVQFETERALQELAIDPSAAIERLKNMLEVVDQTPELTQGTVSELRHRLESSLMSANGRKLEFDERQQLASRNNATVESIRNDILNYERNEEKEARLIGQFNSLMREGNYEVAERVADSVFQAFPDSPEAVVTTEKARIARSHFELLTVRREKERLFNHAVREIYKSTYPIPGDPPLVFPDAEEWLEKKAARAKYSQVRLAGGENERRIIDELNKPYDLVFDQDPFGDVREQLAKDLKINIVIDQNLEGSLDNDTEVSANLVGITLGKGLRTMLKKVDATYVVKDEVLLIISIDDELEPDYLVTDVYNVGDLVAPRSSPSAFGGGGGGFGGGNQGGGGFGGGGQGGGGFGGGGRGGGGGGFGGGGLGGAFCIQDAPVGFFIGEETPAPAKAATGADSITFKPGNLIEVDPAGNPNAAWDAYFESNQPEVKAIRSTVRHMLKEQRHEEIMALINAAIRHDQGDSSWMYQALGLSMQILDRPNSEIERALMSAIDLSDDLQDAMIAAIYMSKNDMVDRSLQVLEDLARTNPSLVQPYQAGLSIADSHNHLEGMRWASVGVLSQEWPNKPELAKRARYAAATVKTELKKAGKTEELVDFEKELANARHRDTYIDVSWTGDGDIDIYVEEPGGTICSRLNPRTTAGGVYYGDVYSNGKSNSGLMKERYVLPKGFSGDYRLIIRRMMGEVTSGKVNVAIHNHFQSGYEAAEQRSVKIDSKGAIVLFKLDGGRRTDDLDKHTLETLVRKKVANKQAAMAQKLASFAISNPIPGFALQDVGGGGGPAGDDFFPGQGTNNGGNQNSPFSTFSPSVVGYSPQITQLPTGTSLQVNHATTADRLYVLISATPNLSTVTEVQTFNILGDAGNATGGGGGGGGGGFGGGFGGGGAGGNF